MGFRDNGAKINKTTIHKAETTMSTGTKDFKLLKSMKAEHGNRTVNNWVQKPTESQ
uniref:Uncharacterized protein n=1 Tax=Ciona intestinalis TaxID=7719 RepID=H2Y2T9_CIOIN